MPAVSITPSEFERLFADIYRTDATAHRLNQVRQAMNDDPRTGKDEWFHIAILSLLEENAALKAQIVDDHMKRPLPPIIMPRRGGD